VDISGSIGTPVVAAGGGIVKSVGEDEVFGKVVMLSHGRGMETLYGHNDEILVTHGDSVHVGEVIARLGSSGQSSAPHVHFEVRGEGRAIDPGQFIKELRSP
jgi:murein DD-endopeptidase MepM/ murein hydrolase activator NlpD